MSSAPVSMSDSPVSDLAGPAGRHRRWPASAGTRGHHALGRPAGVAPCQRLHSYWRRHIART